MTSDQSNQMPKTTITAFVEEDVKTRLKLLAKKDKRALSQLVGILIEERIEEAIKNGEIPADIEDDEYKGL